MLLNILYSDYAVAHACLASLDVTSRNIESEFEGYEAGCSGTCLEWCPV